MFIDSSGVVPRAAVRRMAMVAEIPAFAVEHARERHARDPQMGGCRGHGQMSQVIRGEPGRDGVDCAADGRLLAGYRIASPGSGAALGAVRRNFIRPAPVAFPARFLKKSASVSTTPTVCATAVAIH